MHRSVFTAKSLNTGHLRLVYMEPVPFKSTCCRFCYDIVCYHINVILASTSIQSASLVTNSIYTRDYCGCYLKRSTNIMKFILYVNSLASSELYQHLSVGSFKYSVQKSLHYIEHVMYFSIR